MRFVNFDSSSGFQTAGPVVVVLLFAALALGLAGLRRGAAQRWQAIAGLLLLAVLAWNAVGTLSFPGANAGTLLFMAGIALAVLGGLRGWLAVLRDAGAQAGRS